MKIKSTLKLIALALLAVLTLNLQLSTAFAQGTAFTYQGQLQNNGSPASGTYNLQFSLFNVSSGGSAVAGPLTSSGVIVTNGLFTVQIDFGAGVFTGAINWLQIGVETNGGGSFTTLSPRQQLTPAPYSIFAESANNLLGTVPAAGLSGAYGNTLALYNPSNSFCGNGACLTGVNATTVDGLSAANFWQLNGNGGTTPGINFLGTTDGKALEILAGGGVGIGTASPTEALTVEGNASFTGALYLPAILGPGEEDIIYAGGNLLFYNDFSGNSFSGLGAGNTTTSGLGGGGNTANGASALSANTTGNNNTADGTLALQHNTTGDKNTAIGDSALVVNTTGADNTAIGTSALFANTGGSYNTAIGDFALLHNTSGSYNTANGQEALLFNTTGNDNTATGNGALEANTTGSFNTANGYLALGITNGNYNIAEGYYAGANIINGSWNIDIGNQGNPTDSQIIRIGSIQTNAYIAGIYGTTIATNSPFVVVNSSGQLGTIGTLSDNQLPGNGSITINTGIGIAGGGTVPLGGSITLSLNGNLPATLNLPPTGVANDIIYSGSQLMLFGDNKTNFFVGQLAGQSALSQTIGGENTGIGVGALYTIGTGSENTADGAHTLDTDTTGSENTAVGFSALSANTSGNNNIALGFLAGQNITTSSANIDIGNTGVTGDTGIIRLGAAGTQNSAYIAGIYSTTLPANSPLVGVTSSGQLGTEATLPSSAFSGTYSSVVTLNNAGNSFTGNGAGLTSLSAAHLTSIGNTSGSGNFFVGSAGNSTTSGQQNVAVGANTLPAITSGSDNTAIGEFTMISDTTGSQNTAYGEGALYNNVSGSGNIGVGYQGGINLTGNNNIDIGNSGVAGENAIIRIGTQGVQTACYLAGTVYANGTFVSSSDRNAKENFEAVAPRDVLDKVSALPISRWNYKTDKGSEHIGPMAQDFWAAFKVGMDDKHIATVDEEGVALAAIQGLNQKVEEKEAKIQEQNSRIQNQAAEITELKARLDRLEQAISGK